MMTQGWPGLPTSTTTTTTVLSPEAGLRQVKTNSDIIFHCHSYTGCSLPMKELRIQPEAILELNDEFHRAAAQWLAL